MKNEEMGMNIKNDTVFYFRDNALASTFPLFKYLLEKHSSSNTIRE